MAHGKAWMVTAKRCHGPVCPACFEAMRLKRKYAGVRRWKGKQDKLVPADVTRDRLRVLIDEYGFAKNVLARRTGMETHNIGRIYRGVSKSVYQSTAYLIRKVYEEERVTKGAGSSSGSNEVSSRLSRLIVRGLMAQGWSQYRLQDLSGLTQCTLSSISKPQGGRKFVTLATEKTLLDLAEKIGSTDGESTQTRKYAARNGWKPTIYYDELV